MAVDYEKLAKDLDWACADRDLGGFYSMISPWMGAIGALGRNTRGKQVSLPKTDLSLEEMEELALEFYGELGHGFEEKISKVIMDESTVFRTEEPTDEGGAMAVGVSGRDDEENMVVVVDLHPNNNINAPLTVAHEFAHLLEQRVQEKKKEKTDCLGEIETMFVEQIFIDWMFEKGKISEEDRQNLRQLRTNNLDREIHQLFDEKTIIDCLGIPISAQKLQEYDEKMTKNGDVREKEHFERQIHEMISKPNRTGEYMFRYVFGEIVARAMYQDYQKEPQETLQRLSNFLEKSAEFDFGMRKTWRTGQCRNADQIDQDQIQDCMTCLLGEDFEQKISNVINPPQSKKQNEKTAQ